MEDPTQINQRSWEKSTKAPPQGPGLLRRAGIAVIDTAMGSGAYDEISSELARITEEEKRKRQPKKLLRATTAKEKLKYEEYNDQMRKIPAWRRPGINKQ